MTTHDLGRSTIRWVGGLFIACILLQRFAVPGLPVALILPLVLVGAGLGVVRGLAEFNKLRLVAWLVASGATAMVLTAQVLVLDRALVSLGSWALFVTVWMPFTLQLVDRRRETYLGVLRVIVATCTALALGCVAMMASQFAGVPYRDWLAAVVPPTWLLQEFVITYPLNYGSEIYRANAWIGLEPSMVSFQMGIGLVAALLTRARIVTTALLVAGLIAATSGSGLAILVVALVVMLASSARTQLRRYLIPATTALAVGLASPMGQSILGRVGEASSERSSLGLRSIYPYEYLWPSWVPDLSGVLFGFGPGSSQAIVEQSGILGLLVPTPVKIFFEYGLLAGSVLAAMILLCYVGGHSRALAVSLLVSLWLLQPGTTTILVLMPLLLLVTWWAPRPVTETLEDLVPTGLSRASASPRGATAWSDLADTRRRRVAW